MILYASFEDVMKLPHFEGYTITDMLSVNNDKKVLDLFHEQGIDRDKGLSIQACVHYRNFDKKKVVNYRYVFHERTDKNWIDSGRCSIEVRINRHRNDPGFIGELAAMCDMFRESRDNVAAICSAAEARARKERKKDFLVPLDYQEEMQETIETIKALQHLQESVRGFLLADENILFDLMTDDERLKSDNYQDDKNNPEYLEWVEQQKENGELS